MGKEKHIILISGLSGAGKSTAAHALEDCGYFVVDNLPVPLLHRLITLGGVGDEFDKLALVVDAREPTFLSDFSSAWQSLRQPGRHLQLLFFDASDDVIIRRYKETRRRHPLDSNNEGIRHAVKRERALLNDLRNSADEILFTDLWSVHDLKSVIRGRLGLESRQRMLVTMMSFGHKYGLPPELDLCFDARFLPNPFFVEELRPLSGLDKPVYQYVTQLPDARKFVASIAKMLAFLLPAYQREGKSYVTVAIGCTGGRHRAPALTENLVPRLKDGTFDLRVEHRDISK